MAIKTFYATGAFKYNHRMLTAGDPVDMDAPTSRLYMHLNKISPRKPKAEATATAPAPDAVATEIKVAPKPAPRKAPRKRKAKASK